jgi:hypothetical protein
MTQEALKLALEALEADELDMVDDGSGSMVFRKEQAITAIKQALAQPEQKPMHPQLKAILEEYFDKCFAESAPQRTWVGLTDEEVKDIVWNLPYEPSQEHIRAIEARLKELNT